MHNHGTLRRTLRAASIVAVVALFATTAAAASAIGSQPDTAAIVNGSTVDDAQFAAQWPFVVAIASSRASNQYDGQFCGGTLIDDQHVLTAAHCVALRPGAVSAPSSLAVVAGTRRLDRTSRGTGATAMRRVADVFVHPDFASNDGDGFRFDVAVLRLAEPVTGAATIALVQAGEESLWGAGTGGRTGRIAGWGDTDPDLRGAPSARFPSELRSASIPIHHDARCSSTVNGGYGTTYERATNLCAGTLQSGATLGTDACQGDSGGPLVVDAPGGSQRQAGITSWGEGCGQRTLGAYSRIDALRSWIDSIPGATDGGTAVGGPGGTHAVTGLRVTEADHRRVRIAWTPATSGATAERFAVLRRTLVSQTPAEDLLGITTSSSFRADVPPTRRTAAYTFVVRPVDAGGSMGPAAVFQAGPLADRVAPTTPGAVVLVTRARRTLVVRWTSSIDQGSGIDRYQLQRRIVGRTGFQLESLPSARSQRVAIDELRRSDRVQVRVRAIDRAGNASAWRTSRVLPAFD